MRYRLVSLLAQALSLAVALPSPQQISARTLQEKSSSAVVQGASKAAAGLPHVTGVAHNLGKIGLTVSNKGSFGTGFVSFVGDFPSCEYPVNSGVEYLFAAAVWIGAVVGRDTLVSVGADGWQNCEDFNPLDLSSQRALAEQMTVRSIDPSKPSFADSQLTPLYSLDAKSERDVTGVYYDTVNYGLCSDQVDGRRHTPLNVRVKETSYSWSYAYAEDFVLFDLEVTNVDAFKTLENVYMGIYVDADVGQRGFFNKYTDDVCGFKRDVDGLNFAGTECTFKDTINIAWIADNDGFDTPLPYPAKYGVRDPIAVAGTRVVRTPNRDSLDISFNWWISNGNSASDFGPRRRATQDDPFRDFGGYLGTPEGDRNKYYAMRHQEFDYDQLWCAVDQSDSGWLPPTSLSATFAKGFDTRYLLSFGPFTIFPGETLPISFAHVMGDRFHKEPGGPIDALFNPASPQRYYDEHLDFSDLGINAQWASWLYDNPGVDTDGDGYKGKYRICYELYDTIIYDTYFNADDPNLIDSIVPDTNWVDSTLQYYEGDGVPDFRGASPPPAPFLRLEPSPGKLIIRFNGSRSETSPDQFTGVSDFEGYSVYAGLSNLFSQLTMLASYDRDDYQVRSFDPRAGTWKLAGDRPLSREEVQDQYAGGNRDYDPLINGIDNPLTRGGTQYYFRAQDFNQDDLSDFSKIHRVYPDVPEPHTDSISLGFPWGLDTFYVDSLSGDTTFYPNGELTPDGIGFQFYEYEHILRDVLPGQQMFVSVTAFDYGNPASGITSLESNPASNLESEYPLHGHDAIDSLNLQVVVYPNPYRADGNYQRDGFEGRINPTGLPEDRLRRVHFANLPPECVISIYTLDGDLVRQIEHQTLPNAPEGMHDTWNLVTRNGQSAVSGMYYWVVESPGNKAQIGKLVLIL